VQFLLCASVNLKSGLESQLWSIRLTSEMWKFDGKLSHITISQIRILCVWRVLSLHRELSICASASYVNLKDTDVKNVASISYFSRLFAAVFFESAKIIRPRQKRKIYEQEFVHQRGNRGVLCIISVAAERISARNFYSYGTYRAKRSLALTINREN